MRLLIAVSFLVPLAVVPARSQNASESGPLLQSFRISQTGTAANPSIAYNPAVNEYLVVWEALDPAVSLRRIYGQRLDAATGREIGQNDFPISGTICTASVPAVVYDAGLQGYLVVWTNAVTGYRIGGARLTADATPFGDPVSGPETSGCEVCAGSPASVAYNGVTGKFLLGYVYSTGYRDPLCSGPPSRCYTFSWRARVELFAPPSWSYGYSTLENVGYAPYVARNATDNEFLAVWGTRGQRIDGDGVPLGTAFTIADGATDPPRAVHNPIRNEYLTAWSRYINDDGEYVEGRLLTSAGVRIGASDFRIGRASGGVFEHAVPALAHDEHRDEYLVTWDMVVDGTRHIVGQRLSAAGIEIGADNFAISPADHISRRSAVAYAPRRGEYLIAFASQSPAHAAGDADIYAVRYAPAAPFAVGPGRDGGGELQHWHEGVRAFERQSTTTLPWPTYAGVNGELHPAMGDLDGDGLNETVAGLGEGSNGWLAVFDDEAHGSALLAWIQLPWASYNASNGTTWPAVGDVDGDGKLEIVAGLGSDGGGWFAIFDDAAHGYAFLTWRRVNWPWYNTTQSGETRPAVANVDGGSFSEIVIGLGLGGGGWLELVDDAEAGYAHLRWLRVGWSAYISGPGETYPAAGDVDGDGYDEIVVGLGANSQGWLQVFDDAFQGLVHKGWLQVNWSAYNGSAGATHPAVGDVDGDAAHEIVLGLGEYAGQGGWFEIRDDFTTGFTSLGWRNVGRDTFRTIGGATFPAIGRAP